MPIPVGVAHPEPLTVIPVLQPSLLLFLVLDQGRGLGGIQCDGLHRFVSSAAYADADIVAAGAALPVPRRLQTAICQICHAHLRWSYTAHPGVPTKQPLDIQPCSEPWHHWHRLSPTGKLARDAESAMTEPIVATAATPSAATPSPTPRHAMICTRPQDTPAGQFEQVRQLCHLGVVRPLAVAASPTNATAAAAATSPPAADTISSSLTAQASPMLADPSLPPSKTYHHAWQCCSCSTSLHMTYMPPVFPLHLLATLPLSGKQVLYQYLRNLLRDEPLVSINSENAHFVKHLAENEGALLLSLLGFSLDDDGYFRVHGDLAALHPLWLCAHAELCQYPGVKIRSLPGQPNEIIRSLNAVISTQIGVNFQDSVMTVLEDTRPSVNAARMVFPSRQNPFSLYDRQMAALMLGCIPIFNPIEYEFAYTKRVAENPAAQPFYLDAIEIFTKTASTQEPHERLTALLKRERQQHRHSQTEIEDACYLLNLPFHQLSDVADDMLITVHDLAVSDAPSNAKRYAEALSVLADVRQSQALQAHAAILLTTATTAASSHSAASASHPPSTALVLRSKDAPSPPPLPPLASLTATSSSSPATAAAADAQAMAVDTSAAADATADVVAPTLPIGLTNEGNFCYLNSLLQYFFSLRKLRDLMFREKRLVETSFPRPKPVNPFHDDVEMLVDAQAATERPRSAAAPDYQPAMDRVQQELAKRRAASATNSGQQFLIHMARLFARMVYSDRQAVTPTSELVQLVVKMRPDQASDGQQDVGEYQSIMMDLFEQGFRSLQPDPAAEHPLKSLFMGVTQYIVASKPDPAQPDAPAATSAEAPPGSRVVKEDFISLMVNPAPTLHEALVRSLSGMAAYRDEPVAPSSMSSMPADLVSDLMSSPAARDGRPAVDLPASELPDPDTPQTYIAALPDVLMFQINRVSYDRATGNAYKNQVFLQFPDELHMGRYLATHDRDAIQKRRREELRLYAERRTLAQRQAQLATWKGESTAALVAHAEQFLAAATAERMLASPEIHDAQRLLQAEASKIRAALALVDDRITAVDRQIAALYADVEAAHRPPDDDGAIDPNLYTLHAVFVHIGEANFGHYWLLLRDMDSLRWIKYNDDQVEVVDAGEVFADSTGSTANAYAVVYVRKRLARHDTDTFARTLLRRAHYDREMPWVRQWSALQEAASASPPSLKPASPTGPNMASPSAASPSGAPSGAPTASRAPDAVDAPAASRHTVQEPALPRASSSAAGSTHSTFSTALSAVSVVVSSPPPRAESPLPPIADADGAAAATPRDATTGSAVG